MDGREIWEDVAERLDAEAARLERDCAVAGAVLPEPGVLPAGSVGRAQWRDAGVARSLREAAGLLRDAGGTADAEVRRLTTSGLRVQTWLLARQVEYEALADDRMLALTRGAPSRRAELLAESAYTLGRAKGIRLALEMWSGAAVPGIRS